MWIVFFFVKLSFRCFFFFFFFWEIQWNFESYLQTITSLLKCQLLTSDAQFRLNWSSILRIHKKIQKLLEVSFNCIKNIHLCGRHQSLANIRLFWNWLSLVHYSTSQIISQRKFSSNFVEQRLVNLYFLWERAQFQ